MSSVDLGRLRRAIWLDAERIGDATYTVVGGSAPHTVYLGGAGPVCDCADARERGTICKHQIAALLREGDVGVLKRLRALIPREGPAERLSA